MSTYKKLINGKALYVTPAKIWVARGMKFFAVDYTGKKVSKTCKLGSLFENLLGTFRLSRHALRIGLHHLLPLNNGNLIVTAKRKTFIVSSDGEILNIFQSYSGNKPAHQGVCVTPDGTIFFGEYLMNMERKSEINLYRSTDNGMSFQCVKKFPVEDIRHIHFIKWDKYEKCLWMGTGDYGDNNHECRLYKSADNGNNWNLIGQGSQDWRAIGVCFTQDYLVWGTDAGSTPDINHLIRMSRKTQQLEIISDFEGPCHGCASFKNGRSFFSTGVEGGENEKDRFARLKEFKDGKPINVYKLKKDIWPLIVQYGVMRFPLGTEECKKIVFTAMGLKNHGEVVMVENKNA
jgi:hypothetical protein